MHAYICRQAMHFLTSIPLCHSTFTFRAETTTPPRFVLQFSSIYLYCMISTVFSTLHFDDMVNIVELWGRNRNIKKYYIYIVSSMTSC